MGRRPIPTRVAALGAYFDLATADGPSWRAMSELLDDGVVTGLVAQTRRAMAQSARADTSAVPPRVAASSMHLSMAARLLSPAVGCYAVASGVPTLTPDTLRWRHVGHAVHFAVTSTAWTDTRGGPDAAAALEASLFATVLAPITQLLHGAMAVSPKVLWGNAISAAHGAVTVMGLSDPGLVAPGRDLVASMLRLPRLADTATMAGDTFRRHNCCLFYLAPHGGVCGDCVLREPARSP